MPSLGSSLKFLYTSARVSTSAPLLTSLLTRYVTALSVSPSHFPDLVAGTEGAQVTEPLATRPEESSTTLGWTLYLLAQHYTRLQDYASALDTIERCLVTSPFNVEAAQNKGRILKHMGDLSAAAALLDTARAQDKSDRYLNNKATEYFLADNQLAKAEVTIRSSRVMKGTRNRICTTCNACGMPWRLARRPGGSDTGDRR